MKKFNFSIFTLQVINMLWMIQVTAQGKMLLLHKPGTFKPEKQALNTQGPDQYGKECACTKAGREGYGMCLLKKREMDNSYLATFPDTRQLW